MFTRNTTANAAPAKLKMTRAVYTKIGERIGSRHAEQGGVLGGRQDDGLVSHFAFDTFAERSGVTYSPSHQLLNWLLSEVWNPHDIRLLGFVHSHPPGMKQPSGGDLVYAERILEHIPDLEQLLLPIAQTEPDTGRFELLPFVATRADRGIRIKKMDLEVIESENTPSAKPVPRSATAAPSFRLDAKVEFARADGAQSLAETFQRVGGAYDLSRMAASRVIYIGTGGAAAFTEELARAAVGEHILVDPDIVSATNLATQQCYRRDLGRPKVDALAERISDINPHAVVVRVQKRLEDLDDAEIQRLARAPLRKWHTTGGPMYGIPGVNVPVTVAVKPAATLLCGLTDNFQAQARVNRLALQFGLPSLCAQLYREGRGAEISFTYPGITPACHRCALRGRYQAYENGFRNNVTSEGTPIFSTTRLNSLKGFIAMALLHHGTAHPRWGKLLERIGDRNLVQIRMDPDLDMNVFGRVFGGGDKSKILVDEAVWLPQKADCPANGYPFCPDCGGTGDLRKAIGKLKDTRHMTR